jgi:hypothetical protein
VSYPPKTDATGRKTVRNLSWLVNEDQAIRNLVLLNSLSKACSVPRSIVKVPPAELQRLGDMASIKYDIMEKYCWWKIPFGISTWIRMLSAISGDSLEYGGCSRWDRPLETHMEAGPEIELSPFQENTRPHYLPAAPTVSSAAAPPTALEPSPITQNRQNQVGRDVNIFTLFPCTSLVKDSDRDPLPQIIQLRRTQKLCIAAEYEASHVN